MHKKIHIDSRKLSQQCVHLFLASLGNQLIEQLRHVLGFQDHSTEQFATYQCERITSHVNANLSNLFSSKHFIRNSINRVLLSRHRPSILYIICPQLYKHLLNTLDRRSSPKENIVSVMYKNSIGSGNGLVPNRQQAIIWTNDDLIHLCIYVSQGLSLL